MSEDMKPEEVAQDSHTEASAETASNTQEANANKTAILNGFFGFKVGMASVYSEQGVQVPVTVLQIKPWTVTQVKTQDKDKYSAVQISLLEKNTRHMNKALAGHLKSIGTEKAPLYTREIRQELPEGIQVGQTVDASTFEKGQMIKITATSKGRGFAGTLKRHNFAGGPAAHGSTFHRQPGSVGMRNKPGRILPGKKLPGHFGDETVTVKNVEIVDVQLDKGLVLVKGPVPGARNGLVKMQKQG